MPPFILPFSDQLVVFCIEAYKLQWREARHFQRSTEGQLVRVYVHKSKLYDQLGVVVSTHPLGDGNKRKFSVQLDNGPLRRVYSAWIHDRGEGSEVEE